MAKARSRTAARKVKDRWKAKNWYNVLAPESFDRVTVAETLADNSTKLIKRVTEVSLQDITNDFRKSHIKLFFEIYDIEGTNAHTQYIGHTLTSDYLRRMIRRKRSKIDGIYDLDDCTKVNGENSRIVEIGKKIKQFNRLDMGVFIMKTKTIKEISNIIEQKKTKFGVSDILLSAIDMELNISYSDFPNTIWVDVDNENEYEKVKKNFEEKGEFQPFNLNNT